MFGACSALKLSRKRQRPKISASNSTLRCRVWRILQVDHKNPRENLLSVCNYLAVQFERLLTSPNLSFGRMVFNKRTGRYRSSRPIYVGGTIATDIRSRKNAQDIRRTEQDDPQRVAVLKAIGAKRSEAQRKIEAAMDGRRAA
jgi:hypothetical protein